MKCSLLKCIFSILWYLHSVILHVIVIRTHEEHIDHDTEGDEELGEWIKHNDWQDLNIIKSVSELSVLVNCLN